MSRKHWFRDRDQSRDRNPPNTPYGKFYLILHINGQAHNVRPVMNDAFPSARAFRLHESGIGIYNVAQTLLGHECDCPDFVFLRETIDPIGCEHIKALIAMGVFDANVRPSRHRLDAHPESTLADKAQHEADAYRTIGSAEGLLFARTLDELAAKIRMTQAKTADVYEARIEILEADVRERQEAIGFEHGRDAGCRCGEHRPD